MTVEGIKPADQPVQAAAPPPPYLQERIKFERRNIRYCDIVILADEWAFRGPDELKTYGDTSLTTLVEDIKPRGNIHTAIKVKPLPDGKFLLIAGHRRYLALQILMREKVEGFHEQMEVPADVVISENSELALVACAISENVQRTPPADEGRMRGVRRLHSLGMPIDDIVRTCGMSKSSVNRDLAVSGCDEMMEHLRNGDINYGDAASLMSATIAKNRVHEFLLTLQTELDAIRTALLEDERQRLARDQESLGPLNLKLKDHLPAEQVQAWKEQIKKGLPLGKPTFKYKAMLRPDGGRLWLEIDGISKPIDEMTDEELAKVLARLEDVRVEGLAALKDRVESRKNRPATAATARRINPGIALLKAEGLGDLAAKLELAAEVPSASDQDAVENSSAAAAGAPTEVEEPRLTEAALQQTSVAQA